MAKKKVVKKTIQKPIVAKKQELKPKPEGYVFGRPTIYKPEFCELLIEHCRDGGSIEAFAGKIMVSIDTLYDWFHRHPDFLEAKKIGYSLSLGWWEDYGKTNLLNISESESYGQAGGSSKSKSLNSGVWIYNMKCRFRKQYTEVQKIKQIIDEKSNQTQTIKLAYVPKSLRTATEE